MPDLTLDPRKGVVAFGSGLQGWAFTITHWARLYMRKFGGELSYWLNNLWGNRFFCAKTNKWTNEQRDPDGNENPRGFAMYIMDPIITLYKAIMNDDKKKYEKLMKKLDIHINADEA